MKGLKPDTEFEATSDLTTSPKIVSATYSDVFFRNCRNESEYKIDFSENEPSTNGFGI